MAFVDPGTGAQGQPDQAALAVDGGGLHGCDLVLA